VSREIAPEAWARISPILDELLERPEPDWPALVRERCGDDAELRGRVEALLSAHRRAEGFLSGPGASFDATFLEGSGPGDAEPPPERVGPYHVVHELGRGGMGVVYLAERADGQFEQRVALKLVRRGLDTDEILQRFRRERQILARLKHPNIARLVDGGATEDGRPWFAMEHVEGEPLLAWCARHELSLERRLGLFLAACRAVQHAHHNLVVHRDLKPSNILVDGERQVKLLDFGIARLLESEGAQAETLTRAGIRPMTPEYAAPEQIRGDAATTATDVYGLGLVLYELLSGRRPERGGAHGTREPEPPSKLAPPALRRTLRGDLDTICLAALRDEPERRYGSVEAFARDIERYLAGLPVSARNDTAGYRARKFARRHRFGVAVSAAAAVALVAFFATMAAQARRLALERDRAETASQFLADLFQVTDRQQTPGNRITAREVLERGEERIERELQLDPELQTEIMTTMARAYWGLGLLDKAASLFERVVQQRRQAFGPDDPLTLESMNTLGNIYVRGGRYDEGIELLDETLRARRRVLGPEQRHTLISLNDLAYWTGAVGRYQQAETLQRQALEMRRRAMGPDHRDTLWSLHDLGVLCSRQGRLVEAEAILVEVLATSRRLGGLGDPDVFKSSLGDVYLWQGRYDEAARLFTEAIDSQRRAVGPEHPQTLDSMHSLSITYRDQGRHQQAETLQHEILETQRRVLGSDHPATLMSMSNLARVYAKQDRASDAEKLLGQALEIQRRALGPRHPVTVASVYDMACVAAVGGRRAQALELLRLAVASGWRHAEAMAREPDFQSLRGDPEFGRLVAATKNAGASTPNAH
jgi:serine/threonine-protein kinase